MLKIIEMSIFGVTKPMAEHILDAIEKNGMKPPQVYITGKWQRPGQDCYWEKEDED